MRFSLTGLVRFATIAFLGSSAAAIGVARLAPEGRGWRMPCENTYVNVPASLLGVTRVGNQASCWLDVNRGEMTTLALPQGDVLLHASAAPWVDDRGQSEVVGLWTHYEGEQRTMTDIGFARVSFPDGELREVVSTGALPTSVPTWYPGTGTRVLYASGDGVLYQLQFGTSDKGTASMAGPRPLRWLCELPGGGEVIMSDPHWVKAPGIDRLVLVSLQLGERANGKPTMNQAHIWWLRLSDDGCDIVEAGPLSGARTSPQERVEERHATIGRNASGQLVLAYQRKAGNGPWEIFVSPLRVEGESRRPIPRAEVGRKIAGECRLLPIVFSTDGRWIGMIDLGLSQDSEGTLRRVPLEPPTDLASLTRRDLAIPR